MKHLRYEVKPAPCLRLYLGSSRLSLRDIVVGPVHDELGEFGDELEDEGVQWAAIDACDCDVAIVRGRWRLAEDGTVWLDIEEETGRRRVLSLSSPEPISRLSVMWRRVVMFSGDSMKAEKGEGFQSELLSKSGKYSQRWSAVARAARRGRQSALSYLLLQQRHVGLAFR